MSEQTFQLLQTIRRRLRATIRRSTLAELAFGGVLVLGVVSAVWMLSVAIEAGFWLDVTPRTTLFWIVLAIIVAAAGWFVVVPLLRLAGLLDGPTEHTVAARIGRRFPEISDRMVNLLDLSEGRRSSAPAPLVDTAVRMLGEQVHTVPFERVEDFGRARRAVRYATVPVLALVVFVIAAPGTFFAASGRLLSPGEHFQRPAPFQLMVAPGSVEIPKGATLDLVVHARGTEMPQTVQVELNNADEEHVETVTLTPDSTGAFRHTVVNVRKSMRYRAVASRVQTQWFTATVTERPLVRRLQVALAFPSYTRIPPQRLEPNVGDVTALPGTRVSLDVGVGGHEVAAAFVRFDDGTLDTLATDGNTAEGSFVLARNGTYQIVLRDDTGLENSEPITYTLSLLEDAFPSILFLEPEPNAVLNDQLRAGLRMRINDDFGFSDLRLFYRLAETRFGDPMDDFEAIPLTIAAPLQLDQEVTYDWLLANTTGLDPVPGDVIEYYVQVWDNDAFAGHKSARTAIQRLHLPSLAEQYEQLNDDQDAAEQNLEDIRDQADNIQKQFQDLRDELRRKQDSDWEDERQLDQIQQHQDELEKQVDQLSQQMQDVTRQMEENNLVSDETLQMFQEMQNVIEEINSPELQEALEKLKGAMQDMNLQQMQESMQNFDFSEQQYQERLERALELFKNLRTQQQMEEAAKRAEALAKQQEQLSEETKKLQDETADPQDQRDENKGEDEEGKQQEGEQQEGKEQKSAQQQGEKKEGERQEGQNQQGEQQEGEKGQDTQQPGDQQEGRQQQPRNEELANEQQRASEEMKALEKKLDELREQMEELQNAPKQEMQQLQDQVESQQMPQQMQQNSEQLQQQQYQDAQQGQQQLQQQLQQMSQQLKQMQQSMQGQQQQINMAGLRRALSDVLTLSQGQEDLRAGIRTNVSDNPSMREEAQHQQRLSEGLSVVADSLQSLSRKIPQMSREVQRHTGDALRAMGEATSAMTDQDVVQSSTYQKESMMHLNELALLLSDLLQNMQNGGQGQSGMSMQQMLQQMNNMSMQQQQLNQQIQQMLNDLQGNRLTRDMAERMRQMSRQQAEIQKQLRDLSRNPQARGKMLGDLQRIADQMQETIQELERRQVNRKTIERQQQILQRMLDAQHSIRERGQEKKRMGQEGHDFDRESPDELTPAEEAEKLRRDLIRALDSGYAPDYEELIKRYFELLQRIKQEDGQGQQQP